MEATELEESAVEHAENALELLEEIGPRGVTRRELGFARGDLGHLRGLNNSTRRENNDGVQPRSIGLPSIVRR